MPANVRTGLFAPSAPTNSLAANVFPLDNDSIGQDEKSMFSVSDPSFIESTLVDV
jgi:hypothetical protein